MKSNSLNFAEITETRVPYHKLGCRGDPIGSLCSALCPEIYLGKRCINGFQAGINLADIREFLNANEAKQLEWMNKWRRDIDARLSVLHVAKQFFIQYRT
jgi:hypothetical protein